MGLQKVRWPGWYCHISFGDTHSCQTQDELRTSGYQRSITNPWAHVSALIHLCSSMVLSSVYSTQDSRGTHAPPSLAPLLSESSIPQVRPSSRDGWIISSNSFDSDGCDDIIFFQVSLQPSKRRDFPSSSTCVSFIYPPCGWQCTEYWSGINTEREHILKHLKKSKEDMIGNVLNSPSFFKDTCAGYKHLGWQSLSELWTCNPTAFWPSWVLMRSQLLTPWRITYKW